MVEPVGRVFAAVPLPAEIQMAMADRVSRQSIPGKLVSPTNWHITIRFLGSINELIYERFLNALGEIEMPQPFRIRLGALGAFPNTRRATVVFAGIEAGTRDLYTLHKIADDAAQSVGVVPEERPFRPHVTLARVRPPEDVTHLDDERMGLSWRVDEVVMFKSHLGRGDAIHEPLQSFTL